MKAWLYNAFKRNKAARDFKKFGALIATPGVASIVMPANGYVGVSNSAGGVLTVTVNGTRQLKTSSLAANQMQVLGYIERGKTIASASKTFVIDEWHRPFRIMN